MKHYTFIILFITCSLLVNAQKTSYRKHKPCSFSIDLPTEMKLEKMYEDNSHDYCDYEVKLKNGKVVMELHSLISSKFELTGIKDLYNEALKSSEITITYKTQTANYFVISGINKLNGNIVYWKRVAGKAFISDMRIEYSKDQKESIEPFIGKISKSFLSS